MYALSYRSIGISARSRIQAVRTAGEAANPGRSALSGHILAISARGDRAAFAALFAHFAPRVKSYLLRLGTGPGQAEDMAQEVLLAVWRKAASFDPAKAEASTWVFAIARNLRIDALRRERHPEVSDEHLEAMADTREDAESALSATQRGAALRRALKDLPAEQAEVVRLSFFQDKPHGEIERALGIPLGTVKSRLRLAMVRLRAALGEIE
jgi:RNA polymerase sigma-70 factor (ECF subfamily)